MTTILLLFGFCLSFALGLLVIPKILVIAHNKGLYDMPANGRYIIYLYPAWVDFHSFPSCLSP